MDRKILQIIIILTVYIIIYVIMDFKIKNFISQKYNNVFSIVVYSVFIVAAWFSSGLIEKKYNSLILLLIPVAIILTYILLKKNKTYYLKGIDKKFVKENKNEISNIIREYKNNNLDSELEISFENNNITFNKANKSKKEECLSLIGKYLDENRKKYIFKDYLIYYTKTIVAPVLIIVVVLLIFYKINNTSAPITNVEKIKIEDEFTLGNTEGNINNYGLVTETAEYIYYTNDTKIYKTDKDLKK